VGLAVNFSERWWRGEDKVPFVTTFVVIRNTRTIIVLGRRLFQWTLIIKHTGGVGPAQFWV